MAAAAVSETSEGETLESWLAKATSPLNETEPDWEYIVGFCNQINKELEGPQTAVRLLVHKIQSPQERESLLALTTLETCAKNCGRRFQQEIGKFRFINEIIKVVSPKYLGNHTSEKVKKKCAELLFHWSEVLTHEPKIKEAYQMLRRQGIIKQDPILADDTPLLPPPPPRPKNSIFEEEEKSKLLARLLRSKNPDDLQAANRLIKNMVKQDAERLEKLSKRAQQLETVTNNVRLLSDMLHNHEPGGATESDREIMKELHSNLESQRPNLFRLASDTDERDDLGISEILKTNDEVIKVMSLYEQIINKLDVGGMLGSGAADEPTGAGNKNSFLKDLETLQLSTQRPMEVAGTGVSSSSLLDDQLLSLGLEFGFSLNGTQHSAQKSSEEDDFGLWQSPVTANSHSTSALGAPLQPMTSLSAPTTAKPFQPNANAFNVLNPAPRPTISSAFMSSGLPLASAVHPQAVPGLPPAVPVQSPAFTQSGSLSQPLLRPQSVGMAPGQAGILTPSMASGSAEKLRGSQGAVGASEGARGATTTSVNWFAGDASPVKVLSKPLAPGLESIDEISKSLLQKNTTTNDWKQFKSSEPAPKLSLNQLSQRMPFSEPKSSGSAPATSGSGTTSIPFVVQPVQQQHEQQQLQQQKELRSLADVEVLLESIQPGSIAPQLVYDKNGIKIVLHFGKDRPRADVQTIVASVTSTSSSAVKNFVFLASVPKVLKVKLQPASSTELPAYNPILPPAAITQVMLVAHPPEEKIRLKFKLTYTMNDGDMTDVCELDGLPVL